MVITIKIFLYMTNIMNNNLPLMIKNFIICEYTLRSEVLTNMCNHVDSLNRDNIIHHAIKNKSMNKISTCIMKLNNNYNDSLPLYKTLDYVPCKVEQKFIDDSNFEGYLMYTSSGDNRLRLKINKFFKNVDNEIYYLMKIIGSKSITDILRLKIGENYREIMGIDVDLANLKKFIQDNKKKLELNDLQIKIHNSAALLDILIKYFIPVKIIVSDKIFNNKNTTVLIKKYKCKKIIKSEESSDFKFDVMLDNNYKITIKCAKTKSTFIIFGFFEYDIANTGVITSQVCNNFIYQKKKCLIDYVRDNLTINKDYKDIYLNNMTLGDILAFKGKELVEKISSDYELYNKYHNIKFKIIVNDFLKSNLYQKYTIIRSLLMGPKSLIKWAAMLYGMTKDQNTDSKNNRACVAEIIFRNLNYSHQCKLRKTGQCVKQELERINNMSSDDMDLRQQIIMSNNMSDHIKKCALSRVEEMKSNNNEYGKNKIYVETLIEYPWINPDTYSDVFTLIGKDILKCREKLQSIKKEFDTNVFGQTEFKTVILDIVGKWLSNPKSMGKAIGLCGPPGCGKTLIAKDLGRVLGIPFQEIHLSGKDDGSELNGHSFTYSSAIPGLIVNKMVAAGEPRCIMYFDELDKSSQKHGINEIFNVLIHATDPNTNSNFSDKFFQDVTFPLNKVIFVFSFNDESKIDPILKDRMEIIKVSPYSTNDKIEITKKHIIPELLESISIDNHSILLSNKTIESIISKYTVEPGVRKLKQCIEKIFLKLNIDRIYGIGLFKSNTTFNKDKPITITQKQILAYLGKPKTSHDKIHLTDQIGVINGLYANAAGQGGILPILVYPSVNGHKKPILELTGKQGKVMKESVSFAWTIAKNCVNTDIVKKFYAYNCGGLHIHAPEGAVSKDGPSAGAAFATAFISRLTGYPIKKEIAMTGEISIGGNVTAIGGLEYKLTGAKAAGVKLVFVCEQNLDDLKKIKETNPSLFNLTNYDNNKKVQKVINDISIKSPIKSKNKNLEELSIIVINTIYDIIPYVLLDPEYIKTHYSNKKYNVNDKTCDWKKFMNKNDGGFDNNIIDEDIISADSDQLNSDNNTDNNTDNDSNNSDNSDNSNDT